MRTAAAALAALSVTLGGCDLAPSYTRPQVAVPATYKEVPAGWQVAAPAAAGLPAAWWGGFGDPELDRLEAQAEAGNPSLAASVARYDQAIGELRVARADRLPSLDVAGSAERARLSGRRPLGVGPYTSNDYVAGASLAYEVDLFGRVRNQIKAGRGEAQASAADVRGVRLGLQAQLASTYFQLRGADSRLDLLDATVRAFQRFYDLTQARHQGGIASGLDTNRARSQLSAARAEISATRAQRATYEHAIAALVGVPASGFAIPVRRGDPPPPPPVPSGTPSGLLQRRPDVDAAERRVYAANARIGVARAALYPSLTLGASGGVETTGASILSSAATFWALGPASLALNLFDGGARRGRVTVARGQFAEAADDYKQTVLTAFREVEDDLASARNQAVQERDLADATAAAERTRGLALVRYRDGASDYLDVVTAQTAALDSERALIELKTGRLLTAVDTVRALGGPAEPADASAEPAAVSSSAPPSPPPPATR